MPSMIQMTWETTRYIQLVDAAGTVEVHVANPAARALLLTATYKGVPRTLRIPPNVLVDQIFALGVTIHVLDGTTKFVLGRVLDSRLALSLTEE